MSWRKSSACMVPNETCVEVEIRDDDVLVRHSADPQGPLIGYSHDEWAAFIAGVKDGEFDLAARVPHL
ncbi:MAG: DUF397 domain-containing protein [Sporichthyaceae bacterium]|nr:DUF397 domain-containing protein [Sporichthyaceae bacterium]